MSEQDLSQTDLYAGREQTLIKHLILRKYLQRFAHIIGSYKNAITYVDCFSGPWKVRSEDFKDSSFSIALEELRQARKTHRNLKLRCFFLEKEAEPFEKLEEFASSVTDAEIKVRNAPLEESIPNIVQFVKEGKNSFPFIFIDPTGWTGFALEAIAPLLRLDPSEVLINFMTGHILRFLDSPDQMTQDSFVQLFGSAAFREKLQGLTRKDREDAAVTEYAENVARVGNYRFYSKAIVLHPLFDRAHFHLIYLTRNAKGIEVFKEAEKKAMEEQERERAAAQHNRREAKTRQRSFFSAEESYDPSFYESLRDRYLAQAKERLLQMLQANLRVLYDDAWAAALELPLVWESDLKEWLAEWEEQKLLSIEGRKERQKVPHRNEGNTLVWN